jgi:hypothetical protein
MPALPVRRLATAALCAALLIGAAAPGFTADAAGERAGRAGVSSAPAPDPKVLLAQTKLLHDISGVITPVTTLLTDVLTAKGGKVDPKAVRKQADAVKKAIDTAKKTVTTPAPKALGGPGTDGAKAPREVKADALAVLQSTVDALVKAAAAGDATAVATQVPLVETGLVNVLTATLLGGGLPAPNLSGLPKLPKLPASGPQSS